MSQTDRLLRSPATFRRLTGIDPPAFRQLLAAVRPAWDQVQGRRGARPGRRRKAGAGRKSARPLADRLLMLPIYDRTYVPHTFLGFPFGVDGSTVSRNNRRREPLPAGVFCIPERRVDLRPEEVRELLFDTAERPTYRPTRGQERYYSGQRRRHTIEHQVGRGAAAEAAGAGEDGPPAADRGGSGSAPRGRPRQAGVRRDRRGGPARGNGVRGHGIPGDRAGDAPGEPRGGELAARQKAGNRRIGRERGAVEHGIGKLKIWRIAAERYRNPRRRHTPMMKSVAGLHNRMFAA